MQLMLSDLPPTDAARVHAFVRLGSDRLQHPWTIGAEGSVQLVLYAGESPATIPGTLDAAPYLVRVVDPGTPATSGHTLVRPVGFDALIDALVAAEAATDPAFRSVRIGQAPAGMPAGVPTGLPPVDPAAPAWAAPAAPADTAAAPPAPLDTTVRLKRWPPAALLNQWRYGVRMASFLSARFVSVRELAVLSNVPEEVCAQFVGALIARELVRRPDADADGATVGTAGSGLAKGATVAATSSAFAPPAAVPEAAVRRGLLSRLRDKLGLGAARSPA